MVTHVKVEVLEKVVEAVSDRPRSVDEIAREVGIGWKTCARYLNSLKKIGVIVEIRSSRGSLYVSHSFRKPRLLIVPRVRVGNTFKLTDEKPPEEDVVEVLV